MLMGPVFRAELLRTGRQRRYLVLRIVYGFVLLLIVSAGYDQLRWSSAGGASLADVARFASETFTAFALFQFVTVLLLIPAVFGGAIADEKQRKTLHYIMASRLSSGEIILDKVLGRAAHLAVFVAIGLPIVSLLGLFGGISFDAVVLAYVGTFSTAAFTLAMTILVSTLARRVRDAILASYLLMLIWLLVPPLILLFGSVIRPALYLWIQPVNDALADMSPLTLWLRNRFFMSGLGTRLPSLTHHFVSMVATQLAGAGLLVALAVWRLRPVFRRQEETPVRRGWFRPRKGERRARRTARSACGDDPILWKERYFAPSDRFTRLVLLPALVFITFPLAMVTEVRGDFSRAFVNLWQQGFTARRSLPVDFLWALQVDLGWYTAFWLLAVAGAAASSITIEREKDTWVSLTATPLTAREIVRGKVLGAMWNQRGFAAVLIFLYAASLITGAADPIGWLASIAMLAFLTWFVAIVGAYCSLRASSTSRAMAMTLATLAVFNGYPFIVFVWFIGALGWESSYALLGAMPSYVACSMTSPETIGRIWATVKAPSMPTPLVFMLSCVGCSLIFIYWATALSLRQRIARELDHWLERAPAPQVPDREATSTSELAEATTR